jgi:alkylation response protein AidB-like acyl-CoA dehydrogenase
MLDERWSDDVEEVAVALRRILTAESSSERVRAAEASSDGRDLALEGELAAFGLNELEATPEMFARIAYELGRGLATTGYVETIPVLAVLGRPGVALAFEGMVPASVEAVVVRRGDGVFLQPQRGVPARTAAGDHVVRHVDDGGGEPLGDAAMADCLARYGALTEAARMVGAGQALLAYGVGYAKERQQFGKIIGTYQGVAHRLAQAAGHLDAAELLVRKAAFTALPHAGGDGAPPSAFALMVRSKAIEAARFVAANVHQVFGGNGFAMEYDVQLYSRRLRSWAMRGPRAGSELADLGRLVLDPARRDALQLLWHHERGMPLPRWAREAEAQARQE